MILKELFDFDTYTYTYLLASGIGREGVIIDPVKGHEHEYERLINELDLKLIAAIDTHVHADHITAIGTLRERLTCQSIIS